jgi:hypothetical protein
VTIVAFDDIITFVLPFVHLLASTPRMGVKKNFTVSVYPKEYKNIFPFLFLFTVRPTYTRYIAYV